MAHVNGKYYNNPSQGMAIERTKAAESPRNKQEAPSGGMHVKHLGGGKFETKADGQDQVQQHESEEAMHAHMSQHFGTGAPQAEPSSEPTADGGEALDSLLG